MILVKYQKLYTFYCARYFSENCQQRNTFCRNVQLQKLMFGTALLTLASPDDGGRKVTQRKLLLGPFSWQLCSKPPISECMRFVCGCTRGNMRPGFVRGGTREIQRFGNVRGCTRLSKQGGWTPGAWNPSAEMYARLYARLERLISPMYAVCRGVFFTFP